MPDGIGTALKPATELICVARKPLAERTVARQVLATGTGGLNVDGCRVGTHDYTPDQWAAKGLARVTGNTYGAHKASISDLPAGRWPPNLVLSCACPDDAHDAPGCPVRELDEQSGVLTSNSGAAFNRSDVGYHGGCEPVVARGYYGDTGGASRFFPRFKYEAKAATSERGEGNSHPTVKPVALMRWLVRLVTPPGGTVVDPFAGSGTTLVAARREGFRAIGIEREEEYCKMAAHRLRQLSLFAGLVS